MAEVLLVFKRLPVPTLALSPCLAVRHLFLRHVHLDPDAVARSGNALALAEINVKYRQPLRSGDRVMGTCCCPKATPVRLFLEQTLTRLPRTPSESDQEVVLASATCVYLDQTYCPKRFPAGVIEAVQTGKPWEGNFL